MIRTAVQVEQAIELPRRCPRVVVPACAVELTQIQTPG